MLRRLLPLLFLTVRALADDGSAGLAADFVRRLESHDPKVVADNAAQSMRESPWEVARQLWTVYDPIEVRSVRELSSHRTAGGVELRLEIEGSGRALGGGWIELPRQWRIRYVRRERGWKLAEVHFGEEELVTALASPGAELPVVEPTPLNVAILRKHVTSPPSPPNTVAVVKACTSLAERGGDALSRVLALQALIAADRYTGDYSAALDHSCEAVDASVALGVPDLIASSRLARGHVLRIKGDFHAALREYRAVGAMDGALRDPTIAVVGMTNASLIHHYLGEYEAALAIARAAIARARELEWIEGAALARFKVGDVYTAYNYDALALSEYAGVADELRSIGRTYLTALVLLELSGLQFMLGHDREAYASVSESLALMPPSSRANRANALEIMSAVLLAQGRLREAEKALQDVLQLIDADDRVAMAHALGALGWLSRYKGDFAGALRHAEAALPLVVNLQESITLRTDAAHALRCLGRVEESRRRLEEAVAIVEDLRVRFPGDDHAASRYFDGKSRPFRQLAALSVDEGRPLEALRWVERLKGRAVQDALQRRKVDPFVAMSEEERRTEEALNAEILRLNREMLSAAPSASRGQELDRARKRLEAFRAELYIRHPGLRLRRGEPAADALDPAALRLEKDTLLLDYLLTEDETFLFAVGGDDRVVVARLPLLERELKKRVEGLSRGIVLRDLDYLGDARALYDLLLAPVERLLASHRRVVIIPDGTLWRVPFQLLVNAAGTPLAERVELSFVSSLAMLRRDSARMPDTRERSLLAVGNPALASTTTAAIRAFDPALQLGALPEAESEVREVARLYKASRSVTLIGAEARESVVKAKAAGYDVLHFATHGIADDRHAQYSGLVLASSAAEGEDGILEAREIIDLPLEADLAVLSACDTARGELHAGEGMIGLSWAFLAAGVPATIASQWKTESKATQLVMIELHRRLLAGDSPAQALRHAQMRLRRDRRYRHPFYWAPFVVIGASY